MWCSHGGQSVFLWEHIQNPKGAQSDPKAKEERQILPWDGHFSCSFCTLKFFPSSFENYYVRQSLWWAKNLKNCPPRSRWGLQNHPCQFCLLMKYWRGADDSCCLWLANMGRTNTLPSEGAREETLRSWIKLGEKAPGEHTWGHPDLETLLMVPGRSGAFYDHKLVIVNLNPTTHMHLPGGKENITHDQYL